MKICNVTIPVLEGDVRKNSIQEKGAILLYDTSGNCFRATTYKQLFSDIDKRMSDLENSYKAKEEELDKKYSEILETIRKSMMTLTNMVEAVASKEE